MKKFEQTTRLLLDDPPDRIVIFGNLNPLFGQKHYDLDGNEKPISGMGHTLAKFCFFFKHLEPPTLKRDQEYCSNHHWSCGIHLTLI